MRRFAAGAAVAALSMFGLGLSTSGAAEAAALGKPSAQDVTWMRSNAQTDLAEISLGTLVASKSTSGGTRRLARVTKSQHKTALFKLRTLARHLDVTLPRSPNAKQSNQARQLKKLSGLTFDKTYDQDQIAGHKLSIHLTKGEIKKGQDHQVVGFAKYYLPIAEMHLKMALKLKTELNH